MYYATERERFLHTTFRKRAPAIVHTAADAQPDVRHDEKRSDNDGRERVLGRVGPRHAAENAESENNGVQRSRQAEVAI